MCVRSVENVISALATGAQGYLLKDTTPLSSRLRWRLLVQIGKHGHIIYQPHLREAECAEPRRGGSGGASMWPYIDTRRADVLIASEKATNANRV